MTPTDTEQRILKDLHRILLDVIGDELLIDEPITMETSFNEDLELESIEFVSLAEQLQLEYGDSVDFAGWIAQQDLDALIELKVGDLVRFLASCRS